MLKSAERDKFFMRANSKEELEEPESNEILNINPLDFYDVVKANLNGHED